MCFQKNHERCFIFVCPVLSSSFSTSASPKTLAKKMLYKTCLLILNESHWMWKEDDCRACKDKNWNVRWNRFWRKKHSSLFPLLNNFILIFYFEKISSSPFQILTCQDQKSVCPPKATFFPRDIFKVKRGGPVLYLLPI